VLEEARAGIADGSLTSLFDVEACVVDILPHIANTLQPSLRPVINATGIVVHTNLGRSVLPAFAQDAVTEQIKGCSNLEYNIDTGKRGSRHDHVEALLCELTGAEAAMVVNNNAAAVLLTLAGLAGSGAGAGTKGGSDKQDTIVSRGQLVEIGGSFRIPDVMAASGTNMIEVGTTNKTHLSDYANAIETSRSEGRTVGLLFKAHTSNYRVTGFSSEVELAELVQLGRDTGVLVAEDLGSGVLVDLAALSKGALPKEPTVQESLATGVDVVTFSGDKLLGGPQAGILCGSADVIARLKKHPLARAVRVDKMTLAALEATLMLYRDVNQATEQIPTLRMLLTGEDECRELAIDLTMSIRALLERIGHEVDDESVRVVPDSAFAGGGSLPDVALPSFAVAISVAGMSAAELEERLRCGGEVPIIGRIKDDKFLLSVRTLSAADIAVILGELEILLTHTS